MEARAVARNSRIRVCRTRTSKCSPEQTAHPSGIQVAIFLLDPLIHNVERDITSWCAGGLQCLLNTRMSKRNHIPWPVIE